jgi:hypothetical protein
MAQVIVEFGRVGGPGNFTAGNTGAPVMYGPGITGEEVTTSGTSAATTATATVGDFVSIYNADASQVVWGRIGASPTAAVEQDFCIGPGERREFGPLPAGVAVALINDS